jgi:hypothetical protein
MKKMIPVETVLRMGGEKDKKKGGGKFKYYIFYIL